MNIADKHEEANKYSQWVREVDAITRKECGRAAYDITSLELFYWFKAGQTAGQAASAAISNQEESDKAGILREAKDAFVEAMAQEQAADAFGSWMKAADEATQDMVGLSTADLPDACWQEWYESGIEPKEASDLALMEAGYTRVYR